MNQMANIVERYAALLEPETSAFVDQAVNRIVAAKERGGKVFVATGSGPNIHEGITTFISKLMEQRLVDSVSTSSAVVAHEMAGTLDRVHRVNGAALSIPPHFLPKGGIFEFTLLSEEEMGCLRQEMVLDENLITRGLAMPGSQIIKAAGNMAYPVGLRTERLARDILSLANTLGLPFETVAGFGADPSTMIGAGARLGKPVLVSIPQLVGGGGVGIAIADSIPVANRSRRLAHMLSEADIIIESAVALTQEIHDGPFEMHTGHGIWSLWDGYPTYSLEGKTLIRMDLDPNLKKAWELQRESQAIQQAVDKGLPKTKLTGIPFRMEMSGFARHEGSLPLVGDIGLIWPVLFGKVALRLGIDLEFISHPQQTPEGAAMRDWIVENVHFIDRRCMMERSQACQEGR